MVCPKYDMRSRCAELSKSGVFNAEIERKTVKDGSEIIIPSRDLDGVDDCISMILANAMELKILVPLKKKT